MKTKKLLSLLLAVVLILSALPIMPLTVFAEEYSGSCGTSVTWSYDVSTATLTISGTGEMTNYSYDYYNDIYKDAPWNRKYSIGTVVINSGVTSIGDRAFYGCSGLTSIAIPDSVTSIGGGAFNGCTRLKSVTIPDSVTSIGESVFNNCSGLTSVTIGNSVTSIGGYAFYGCSGLTSIAIPDSVTSIGGYAFYGCSGLTSIAIPDSVTSIDDCAFRNCTGLTSITIPDSVNYIGYCAFVNTGYYNDESNWETGVLYINNYLINSNYRYLIGGYTIKANTRIIADFAFASNTGLTSIIIPDSVTSIGNYAFYSCSGLTSITISDTVTSICYAAFGNCSITDLIIADGSKTITKEMVISKSTLEKVTIPDSVTSIGNDAFRNCTELTSVTIGNLVTSIGDYAFYGCNKLTSITIPDSVTSIGGNAFGFNFRLKDIYYAGTEQEKNSIQIYSDNFYLSNAKWHYNCNPNNPACEHAYKWKIIKMATLTEKGSKQEICTKCGFALSEEEEIPALGVTYDIENATTSIAENISVAVLENSNLPETVEVKAEKASVNSRQVTYEIHLEDNGEQIQPDAPVLVRLPIPEGFDESKINVYRTEPDGSKTRLNFIIDSGCVYFETEHFSIYELIEKICGDINGDESLNNKDLVRLFKYLSEWNVEVDKLALDVNGDGKVNNKDLLRLFKYLSNWNVEIY